MQNRIRRRQAPRGKIRPMGAATWNGLHTRDAWYSYTRPCREIALSLSVRPAATPTRTEEVRVGGSENATCKDIRSGMSASALTRRGLRQLSRRLHRQPRATVTAHPPRSRWVADLRHPSARERLWHRAVGSVYTTASSAAVHPAASLRSSHLIGDHRFYVRATAVKSACSVCQGHAFPSCTDCGSAPRAHGIRDAALNTCCSNARVSRGWEACWRLPFTGITSCGRVLELMLPQRRCLRRFLLIVPLLLRHSLSCPVPPQPCCRPGPSPPLAHEVPIYGSCRGVVAWCLLRCVGSPEP